MRKGFNGYGLMVFYVMFMLFLVFIMSASGWSGITHSMDTSNLNGTITDPLTAGSDFLGTAVGLFTLQSEYELFNVFLIGMYIMLIIVLVDLIWVG